MRNAGTLRVTTPSDREIVLTRVFDAPRHLVFDALSKPELLKRWFGPRGWSLVVCDVDLRVGGTFRFVLRGPDGLDMGMRGVYREIVPPERSVHTESFDDYPGESIVTTVLVEHNYDGNGPPPIAGNSRRRNPIRDGARRCRELRPDGRIVGRHGSFPGTLNPTRCVPKGGVSRLAIELTRSSMPKSNITTRPLTAFSVMAARVAFAAAALFVILLVALHFLEPQLDPSWRFISEYQLGDYGWMMSLAFFSMMVSSVALLMAIQSQIRTVGGYVGLFFLVISAIGFGLAAFFTSDPITATEASTHGMVHNTAALLGGNIPGAAYFLGWSLARNVAWITARRSLLWITGLAILGNVASLWMQAVIGLAHAKFGPGVGIGWPNRVLIVAFAAWLMALAWQVIQLSRMNPPSVETDIPAHGVYR